MDEGYEWHEPRRALNLEKHGIDFEDALTIWTGPVLTAARRACHGRTLHLDRRAVGANDCRCLDPWGVPAAFDFSEKGEDP